jgi:hypothetical protein
VLLLLLLVHHPKRVLKHCGLLLVLQLLLRELQISGEQTARRGRMVAGCG